MPRSLLPVALCATALFAAPAAAQPRPLLPERASPAPLESGAYAPPVLLEQVASFGAARLGEWVYVYSGHAGPTHAHSRDNLSPAFSRLSLSDGQSWELLPMGPRLQSTVLLAQGERLLRVGGMTALNAAGEEEDLRSLPDVASYDPGARRWSALTPLPRARSSHAAALLGERLYVVGGWSLGATPPPGSDGAPAESWPSSALALDLSQPEPSWSELPPPPFSPRRALAAVGAAGRLVVLGGMLERGEFTREVHLFEPQSGVWSRGPDLPCPGFGVAAVALGAQVYASGLDSALFRLDLAAPEPRWEEVGTLAFPRYFHQLLPLGSSRLLALGGVTRPLRTRHNVHLRTSEVLELAPTGPQLSAWSVPVPSRAKNRQGAFLFFDALWLFGGNDSLAQHDFAPERFQDAGWRLDLATLRTTPLPPYPVRRQSMRTLTVPGERPSGLSVGGFGHTGQATQSFAEAYRFDFQAKTWTPAPEVLPRPRTQFALARLGEALYAFGGLDYDSSRPREQAFGFPREVLVSRGGAFEPTGAQLPRPRRAFGGALLGERFYLVGGMRESFQLVEEVDVFDLPSQTWTTIPAPSEPRISPQLLALGGKLYLLGGTTPRDGNSFAPNQRVEEFDPERGTWRTLLERLPLPVSHLQAFAWRERILCYSAQEEAAQVRLLVLKP